jgi:uncharacterized protein (TIGR03545 family)
MMKWIRWKGFAAFIVISFLITLVWLVVVDWMAEKAIETVGTKAVGAKVEVLKADVTLFPAGIGISGLVVANPEQPMTNSVEIEYLHAALELPALIQRKLIVDDLRVEGLQLDTPRKTSGAIDKSRKDDPSKTSTSESNPSWLSDLCDTDGLPLFSMPKADDILSREPLQSVKQIQALNSKIGASQSVWKKRLKNLPDQKDIQTYQARAKKLKQSTGGLGGLIGSASEAQTLYKDLQKDIKKIEKAQNKFKAELKALEKAASGLTDLPAKELKRIMSKYGFSADGIANWSHLLFGRNLCGWWQKVYHWYQRAAPYLSRLPAGDQEPQTQKPVRNKGLDVKFQEKNPKPDLLVRSTHVDAQLQSGQFEGRIENITSHPQIVGAPLTFKFMGKKLPQVTDINLNGVLNFMQPQLPQHTIKLAVQGYQVSDLALGTDALNIAIKRAAANLDLNFKLNGGYTDTRFAAQLSKLKFSKETDASSELVSVLLDAISKTKKIGLTATLKGREPTYQTTLNSNLEGILQKAAGRLVKREAAKLESQLRKAIDNKLKTPIKDAQARMSELHNIGNELLKRSKFSTKVLEQIKLPI